MCVDIGVILKCNVSEYVNGLMQEINEVCSCVHAC